MTKSKVVSLRVPPEMLKAVDQRLAQYPRRFGRNPTRSELILDAVAGYVGFSDDADYTVNKEPAPAGEDIETIRDRILSSLKVGKQSGEYKRTKVAMDRFISELGQPSPPLPALEFLPKSA